MNTGAFGIFFALVLVAGVALLATLTLRRFPEKRHRLLLALRILAALILGIMLVQPQCHQQITVEDKPELAVLIDDSQSMQDGPAGQPTRADAVRAWLASPAFQKISEQYRLRPFAFDRHLRDTTFDQLTFNGTATRITTALDEWRDRWKNDTDHALLFFSDGLVTDGTATAPSLPVPVFVLEVEKPGAAKKEHIQLWQIEPPRHALAGAESTVRAVLQGRGVSGRDVHIEWWSDNRKLGEKRLRFQHDGEVIETTLTIPPLAPGTYPLELRVNDPAADAAARSQPFVLTVRQEARRLLFLQNALSFDGKFVRQALAADRNLRLESFTRWQDGRWARLGDDTGSGSATLDLSAAGLEKHAAVILADVQPAALSSGQWQALADFVDRGGGLVVLGGPNLLGNVPATPAVARLLPVTTPASARDGQFAVRLTEPGARHTVFGPLFNAVGNFPALQSMNLSGAVAPNAQVLMEGLAGGQSHPLIVVKQQGAGRVAAVLTDTLWRWRTAGAGWSGRLSPYDTFWAQLTEWIAPDTRGLQTQGQLELTTDHAFYRQGDTAQLRAEWLSRSEAPFSSVAATVTTPDGATVDVILQPALWESPEGRTVRGFRAEFPAKEIGLHTVNTTARVNDTDVTGTLRFAVTPAPGERRGEVADDTWLHQLAQNSRGGYFTQEQAEELLQALPRPQSAVVRERVIELWNNPWLAGLLLLLLCGEWWLRRKSSLP